MKTIYKFFTLCIDIIFPKTCARCGECGTFFCTACMQATPHASLSMHSFISARFDYKDPAIRNLIWRFKYQNGRGIAESFGRELYEEILGTLSEQMLLSRTQKFLLLPVPLHKNRQRNRGYNQSELLVREIQKYDIEKIFHYEPTALIRTRETKQQAQSEKRKTRFENLRGAFFALPFVKNKNVLLIDDVTTTGATLCEARKALLKAGAISVTAFTVAH